MRVLSLLVEAEKSKQDCQNFFLEVMNVTLYGFVKDVSYRAYLTNRLQEYDFHSFDVNTAASSGLIVQEQQQLAYSKWVSPKRTRSYPFERMYNTFNAPKIATIIPIIKDEGRDGDLDKIQYSTFSWMNLLNIYVVLAYYDTARKNDAKQQQHKHKVTEQRFDAEFVNEQLREIMEYRQSALHWNRSLIEDRFTRIFERAVAAYSRIALITGVKMHSHKPLTSYLEKIQADFQAFKNLSLKASQGASKRELQTHHKHEFLQYSSKANIVVENYLGGLYYLTADEVLYDNKTVVIQESKNATQTLLPSLSDIKDGLFKLILFSNLDTLIINDEPQEFKTRLHLTGTCVGSIALKNAQESEVAEFVSSNPTLSTPQQELLQLLRQEAQANEIEIVIASNRGTNG